VKKICPVLICTCFLLFAAGCGNTDKLLDFTSSDVENIEIYMFNVPINAEKKTVTGENDIKAITDRLNSVKIEREATPEDSMVGGGITFVFNKTDGTQFIINYDGSTVKTPDDSPRRYWYKVDDDSLSGIWDDLDYPSQMVHQDELPTINS